MPAWPSSAAPPGRCHTPDMPRHFALSPSRILSASSNGTLIVTFTNPPVADFAVNWARLLHALGLRSLLGISARLRQDAEDAAEEAGATLFCADGPLMQANGQAGRWSEAVPVLEAAARLRLHVLISDADIGWMRDPRAYFAAALRAHPPLDFLLLTDRAFNGLNDTPLPTQPDGPDGAAGGRGARRSRAGRGGAELDLEPGFASSISYNIGVVYIYSHALARAVPMMRAWVAAVGGEAAGASPRLAAWDQEPINKQVLQRGMRPHERDGRLVRVLGAGAGGLAMGVLPMLQFTTAFSYFLLHGRREALGARPYCLHAIFAHGKEAARKRAIFRSQGLWIDPPAYYSRGRYLSLELSVPASMRAHGGFDLITSQLRQVHAAMRLASYLNRTLVLPRLRCGDLSMAYPCYAWYHRAMGYFGLNRDKVGARPASHQVPSPSSPALILTSG